MDQVVPSRIWLTRSRVQSAAFKVPRRQGSLGSRSQEADASQKQGHIPFSGSAATAVSSNDGQILHPSMSPPGTRIGTSISRLAVTRIFRCGEGWVLRTGAFCALSCRVAISLGLPATFMPQILTTLLLPITCPT